MPMSRMAGGDVGEPNYPRPPRMILTSEDLIAESNQVLVDFFKDTSSTVSDEVLRVSSVGSTLGVATS